jgi:hypothetical protein
MQLPHPWSSFPETPIELRWLLAHNLTAFKPWWIEIDGDKCTGARAIFRAECVEPRDVMPFAYRQDNDDMAGFEVCNGIIQPNIICFHPAWTRRPEPGLIDREFPNLWAFLSELVIPDMADWASEDDLD